MGIFKIIKMNPQLGESPADKKFMMTTDNNWSHRRMRVLLINESLRQEFMLHRELRELVHHQETGPP